LIDGSLKGMTTFTNTELTIAYLDTYKILSHFHILSGFTPDYCWTAGLTAEAEAISTLYANAPYERAFRSSILGPF
jgi:hypothetical protein